MHQPRKLVRVPRIWLMTDKRNDGALETAIMRLPRGSGIIFRHHHLDTQARSKRFRQIKAIARRYGHHLLLAGPPALARSWGAAGVHGRKWKRHQTVDLLHSAPVHSASEITTAKRNGADLFLLSPAAATRSHPDKKPLNRRQLQQLSALCDKPVILLGGMNRKAFGNFGQLAVHGWAAIDGLSLKDALVP